MNNKVTTWALSGLLFAAAMAGVLGFTFVTSTSAKESAVKASGPSLQSSQADSTSHQVDMEKKNGEHQTVRVFWPIWNGRR